MPPFSSNKITALLRNSCSVPQFEHLHGFLLTSSRFQHKSSFASSLSLCRRLHFSVHPPPTTTKRWNIVIRGVSESHGPSAALVQYRKMRRSSFHPDEHTFPLLLKLLSKLKDRDPMVCYPEIIKHGLDLDCFVRNSLISSLANYGNLNFARQVFDESPQKEIVTWTAMIDGYVKNGSPLEGIRCFLTMRSIGVKVDEFSVASALLAAGMMNDVWIGRWIHGFYVESGRVKWDAFVGSALVDMYMKCGYFNDACQVFDEMPTRNVISWSGLVSGFVHLNRYNEALQSFQDMLIGNVKPNPKTLTSVVTACAQLGALEQGKWIHRYIELNSIELNSILGTSLIDMYMKCGCINEARFIFNKLPKKGLYTWTAMINGFAMNGDPSASLRFFSRMMSSGIQPNKVTFLAVLGACSHNGLVNEGRKLFEMMKEEFDLEPDVEHYGCMVDLLGRAGYLGEAMEVIKGMPMEPSFRVWGALLGACVIHKDFELGEWIGNRLVKLEPDHGGGGGGYSSLLANVYSARGKWDDAASVRKVMKGKRIGVSWIDVNGEICEFVAFDMSHPCWEELCRILKTFIRIWD